LRRKRIGVYGKLSSTNVFTHAYKFILFTIG
jgi:hypothetical protein